MSKNSSRGGQSVTATTGSVDLARNTQPVLKEKKKKEQSSGNISHASESLLKIALELHLLLVNKVVQRSSASAAVQEMLSGFRWTSSHLLCPSARAGLLSILSWA